MEEDEDDDALEDYNGEKGIELLSLINSDARGKQAKGSLIPALVYSIVVAIGAISMGFVHHIAVHTFTE